MKFIDVSLIISVCSGGLYFAGYVHDLHYLDYFSAPHQLFIGDISANILAGWATLFERAIWLFCLFGLYFVVRYLVPNNKTINTRFSKLVNTISFKVAFTILITVILYQNAVFLGKEDAKDEFSSPKETCFKFKNGAYDGFYRILAFEKGNYLLLDKQEKIMVIGQTYVKSIHFDVVPEKTNRSIH